VKTKFITCPLCHSRNTISYFVKVNGYLICGDCVVNNTPEELRIKVAKLNNLSLSELERFNSCR